MAADPVFVDTNVLVFANRLDHPRSEAALEMLRRAEARGSDLWISRQILREYLAVVTRPQQGAAPASMVDALADARFFAERFAIAEDGPEVTARLFDLLARIPTAGRQVHDANIVATMLAHGIGRLATFNKADFIRFGRSIELEAT